VSLHEAPPVCLVSIGPSTADHHARGVSLSIRCSHQHRWFSGKLVVIMGRRKEGGRMASPFPGMDPYLERSWGDVHQALIIYAREQLQPRLPGDLRARVEERVFVASADEPRKDMYPDVRVIEARRPKRKVETRTENG